MSSIVEIIVSAVDKTGQLEKTKENIGGIGSAVSEFTKAAGPYIAAFTTIAGVVLKVADAAGQAELIQTQLNATLASTGKQAEITGEQLAQMAETQMRGGIFDDEQILQAANALLRFSSVAADNIPQITQVAIDMASALGTDVVDAANQIGRALETGTIPRLWGFSDALKGQVDAAIKAGDESQALSIIMEELNNRFGGQGLAALTTYTGATKALNNEFGNLTETAGNRVLPIMTMLKFAFADVLVAAQEAAAGTEKVDTSMQKLSNTELDTALQNVSKQLEGATTYSEKYLYTQTLVDLQQEKNRRSAEGLAMELPNLGGKYANLKLTIEETNQALAESDVSFDSMYKNVMDVQGAYTSLQTATQTMAEDLRAANQAYLEGDMTAEEHAQKIQEIKSAYDDAKAANEKWMKQFILSAVQMKLAEGGLTNEEFKQLLLVGEKLGLIDPEVAATTQSVMDAINGTDPEGLDQALADMQKLFGYNGKSIDVTINVTENHPTGGGAMPTPQFGTTPQGSFPIAGAQMSSPVSGSVVNNHYYYGPKILFGAGLAEDAMAVLTE